jgi:hypothetical protein
MQSTINGFGLNLLGPAADLLQQEGMRDAYLQWLRAGRGTSNEDYLQYNSFSGTDMKAAIWIPPNPLAGRHSGTYKIWAELQTITVSSARPPGPVRCLGMSNVRDYTRGPRTIAGSLIFTVLDRDVFYDVYQRSHYESPTEVPIFVDAIPPFHLLIDASNEMGAQATTSIVGVTLTNWGTTYSVDDLMVEATYSYVAKFVSPFANKREWRNGLAQAVSMMTNGLEPLSSRSRVPRGIRVVSNRDYGTAPYARSSQGLGPAAAAGLEAESMEWQLP